MKTFVFFVALLFSVITIMHIILDMIIGADGRDAEKVAWEMVAKLTASSLMWTWLFYLTH